MMNIVESQEIIELSNNVRVSVLKYHNGVYEMAVLTNWYPYLSPDEWNIDYTVYDDVITVDSSMQVYGTLQEIRENMELMRRDIKPLSFVRGCI